MRLSGRTCKGENGKQLYGLSRSRQGWRVPERGASLESGWISFAALMDILRLTTYRGGTVPSSVAMSLIRGSGVRKQLVLNGMIRMG